MQPHQITIVQAPPVQGMMHSPGVPVPRAHLLHTQMSPRVLPAVPDRAGYAVWINMLQKTFVSISTEV